MSFPFSPVALARPETISGRELNQLTRLAHDARHSLISEAEAEWVLAAAGPIFEECRRWRAWAEANGVAPTAANIIQLPVAR